MVLVTTSKGISCAEDLETWKCVASISRQVCQVRWPMKFSVFWQEREWCVNYGRARSSLDLVS